MDLSSWNGVPRPQRIVLDGRYARLEPLDAGRHESELLQSALEPGADIRFRYLFEETPGDAVVFRSWIEKAARSDDPLFFAVINKKTGRAEGRQALMRIDPVHGVIEIGNILWGPAIARTRVATEALYLFAEYVFDTLGYRRFEWKCNDRNEPSRRAALRFGFTFEGIFRQHMVTKGENRNTAWFAMTDGDWSLAKNAYQAWLRPENFHDDGQQKAGLKIQAFP
jgi:RimJ/RimL family protein N-acetyltransferase